ncbi:hypothetical protein [Escherichia coli]
MLSIYIIYKLIILNNT